MTNDAIGNLLNYARRRLWLQGLIDRGWLGLILMSGILGLAAIVHTFFIPMTMTWWGPAVLLPLAVVTLITAFNRPSLEEASRAADRGLNSHDLLTAACYLRSQNPRPTSSTALVVLDQANRVAINASRSLSHLRKARHPLPIAMAIAVAATSLFFLSLGGAASSGGVSAPVFIESITGDQEVEDHWLPVFEPGLTAASADVEGIHTRRDPTSSTPVPSKDALPRASPGTGDGGQDELDSNTRANALQVPNGAGAGRVASKESPPGAMDRKSADGNSTLDDLELVTVQRTPTDEAAAIDHTLSSELISFESDYEQSTSMVQNLSAARPGKEPFSPAVGPAFRALQVRYFEETPSND